MQGVGFPNMHEVAGHGAEPRPRSGGRTLSSACSVPRRSARSTGRRRYRAPAGWCPAAAPGSAPRLPAARPRRRSAPLHRARPSARGPSLSGLSRQRWR